MKKKRSLGKPLEKFQRASQCSDAMTMDIIIFVNRKHNTPDERGYNRSTNKGGNVPRVYRARQ